MGNFRKLFKDEKQAAVWLFERYFKGLRCRYCGLRLRLTERLRVAACENWHQQSWTMDSPIQEMVSLKNFLLYIWLLTQSKPGITDMGFYKASGASTHTAIRFKARLKKALTQSNIKVESK